MGTQIIIIVFVILVIFYFFGKNFSEPQEDTSLAETVKEEPIKEVIKEISEEAPVIIIPEELKKVTGEEAPVIIIPEKLDEVTLAEPDAEEIITEKKNPKETVVAVIRQNDTVESLWKFGTEAEWRKALAHYYDLVSKDTKELNENMASISADEIKNLSVEEFFMFLHDEYLAWKYTDKRHLSVTRKNLVKYVAEDKLSELSDIHKRLFEMDLNDIKKSFKTAGEIKGLSLSGASSLLSVLFPDKFGTVEKYTAEALIKICDNEEIKEINPESLKLKDAVLLEEIMRDKAKELNEKFKTNFWTPRKIDMIFRSMER